MFDYIVKLILKNKFIRKFMKNLTYFILGFYIFIVILGFLINNTFLFNPFYLKPIFYENKSAIIVLLTCYAILLTAYIIYLERRSISEDEKEIHLKLFEISPSWLKYNKDFEKTNEYYEEDLFNSKKENISNLIKNVQYSNAKTNLLFQSFISSKKELFSIKEIGIVIELLDLFNEDNSTSSSVASKYTNDNENQRLKETRLQNNKTNYELLSRVKLVDHTYNVVEEILKLYNEEQKNSLAYAELVITAIAHDIGKLLKKVEHFSNFDPQFLRTNSHSEVSVVFLSEIAHDYSKFKKIKEAIISHHRAEIPKEYLSSLLYRADKNARRIETNRLLQMSKQEENESIDDTKKNTKTTPNNKEKDEDKLKKMQKMVESITSSNNSSLNEKENSISNNKSLITNENKEEFLLKLGTHINSYDYMSGMISDDINENCIESFSQEGYVYFTFKYFRECASNFLKNKKLSNDEIKAILFFLKDEKVIITKEKRQFSDKLDVYNWDNYLFSINLIPILLIELNKDKELVQKEKDKKTKIRGLNIKKL